jgi:hypothetical protein
MLASVTSDSASEPSWYDLLVTVGDPDGKPELVRPPRRARVTTTNYRGQTVVLELDVVARAPGHVLVAQPREGREPWNAWIRSSEAVPLETGQRSGTSRTRPPLDEGQAGG